LSGGQRQRVALGRAIIRKPKVLLMDEPLSNLDAKLRNSMRREIAKLHHKLGVTTVFVTHDQIEAMTLGQRIAVMNNGMIEQVGSPKEIYSEPMNRFVASFIGNPPMNFINASCWPNEKKGVIIELKNGFRMEYLDKSEASKFDKYINREILLGIRSEHIAIQIQPPVLHRSERDTLNLNIMKGIITLIEPIGSSYQIALDVGLDEDLIVSANSEVELTIGMKVYLEFSTRHLHFFDATTEKRIQI
jgi:multiple sugar transport system ATP-binding protein